MCPAIHINSRSWLRSSSTHEPSDPPLRVLFFTFRPSRTGNEVVLSAEPVRVSEPAQVTTKRYEGKINQKYDATAGRNGTQVAVLFEPR